jgi:diguanylate cyclase (GGDEF)-like protein/PAS domain S-box-containing protein
VADQDKQASSDMSLTREDLQLLCFRNLLATPGERLFFKDLQSRFLLVSESLARDQSHGFSVEELIGKTDFDVFSDEHALAAYEDEQRIIQTGKPMVAKIERETFHDREDAWVSTTKLPLLGPDGQIVGTFGVSRDVTAQVMAERALAHQALHDTVTGLANRLALMDRLSQALVSLDRTHGQVALFFIDLDNFKTINDSLGHEAGDRVLVEVGRRLGRICRRSDTVARFGGDEFVLLCSLRADEDVRLIASRAVRAIGKKFSSEGDDLTVTASVGVIVTADPSSDPGTLLQQADLAMYEAKSAGRDGFRLYDSKLRVRAMANHDFDATLRKALDKKELFLLYQPHFALDDQSLRGVEALVRWKHPERGVVLPGDFIPLAEERGLIASIDTFVFDEACRQLAAWVKDETLPDDFTMAVNLSGRQLSDPQLVERVASSIKSHGVSARQLCLEITETALIGELGEATTTLADLSKLGVRIALDDFGTGYSTLAHVQRLNVDILKIDRSFVEQIGGSDRDRDREIIAAITAMAHALGMSVVGEGIETTRQLGELTALGCDTGQGYLLARPLPAEQVAVLARSSLEAAQQARTGVGV